MSPCAQWGTETAATGKNRLKDVNFLVRRLEDIYYYTIAGILSVLAAMLLFSGEKVVRDDNMAELLPVSAEVSDSVHSFRFAARDVEQLGGSLAFLTEHQTVTAYADGTEIYQLKLVHSRFGKTPGKCWNFVEIPAGTFWLTVEFIDVYEKDFNENPEFFAGDTDRMMEQLMRNAAMEAFVSLFHIIAGAFMILFWLIINNKAQVNRALIFLGMIELCLGIWFLGETDIMLLLLKDHRNFATFLSMLLLMFTIMPFVSFVRELFGTGEKIGWTVLYVYNVLGIGACVALQLFGVADVEELVFIPYGGFALMVLYVLYSVAILSKKGFVSGKIKLHISSTLLLLMLIAVDLFKPGGPPNLGVLSNLGLAVYLVVLGCFAASEAMRQLEETKRSLYYEELAYTDISTGFGSRNAYLLDVEQGRFVPGHLVITFDLNELKRTNDRFGHLTGDRYIKDAAKLIRELFGPYGKCYRIGGDEFCIISSKLRRDKVERLLHALCREQERYNKESSDVVMGIACGYAVYVPDEDESLEDTRKRADEMMYRHKAEMKNVPENL